jgi:hypothetical protein
VNNPGYIAKQKNLILFSVFITIKARDCKRIIEEGFEG